MLQSVKIPTNPRLLGSSQKVVKGEALGWGTAILYLAASDRSTEWGGGNTCPMASPGCREACLGHTAGRLRMAPQQAAQIWKTWLYFNEPKRFFDMLAVELQRHVDWCYDRGFQPAVRLNGSSDIAWERLPAGLDLMNTFCNIRFYDYTKISARLTRQRPIGPNYHLTFSRSETNDKAVRQVMVAQGNVAVVFASPLPKTYLGAVVINGDKTDLRFLDPRPCIVGLSVKGHVKDDTGFVVKGV